MADKKLAALQDEIKLLKGEVKQSLASVRDYLLNMELPSAEISTILQALGAEGEQRVTVGIVGSVMMFIPVTTVELNHHMTMRGSFEMPTNQKPKESLAEVEEDAPEEPADTFAEEDQAEPDNIFTTEEETYTDEEESDDASVVEEEEPDDASLVEEEEVPPPAPRNAGTGSMAGDTEADILPDEEPEPIPEEEDPSRRSMRPGRPTKKWNPCPGSGSMMTKENRWLWTTIVALRTTSSPPCPR